ncbi:hypothetical protein [Zunongwangia sp. HGR-M22]|uniref:hypothetical protein n=1 Tax=Zunongwangia sp. HGR-M22 TaxID=3015168 RepID=UPI0022DE93FD|nr:hypothetical protein [Zunongwangia sp. HGR-M22]WBL26415.1 hypothetical protein PBT91_03865 [Zunongwangia sp. HGR-M22]
MTKKERQVRILILIITPLIFAFFIIRSCVRFEIYKSTNFQGRILEIKDSRMGKIFRVSGSNEFEDIYIDGNIERLLEIRDSISKPKNAKEVKVYRNNQLLGRYPIIY